MKFEIVFVNEYSGNNFCGRREARYYENGHLEYIPEPDLPDEDDDEEEMECATTS